MTTMTTMTTTASTRRPTSPAQPTPKVIERPPTLFGRQSPWPLVHAGHTLATRAIGYALEQVPRDDAVRALLAEATDRDVARMAWHYLAFSRFDVGIAAQAHAFFLLEDVLRELDERARREALPLHRAGKYLRHRLGQLRRRIRPPMGGRLRPAI
jgi:hypothetical protein